MAVTPVGLALRPERYDSLTVQHIPAKYWISESQRFAGKWWDYRIMHPMQATYHFANAYKIAYQRAMAQRDDWERAQHLIGLRHDDFLDCAASTRTALWIARQAADQVGCPYSFYCSNAMQYAQRRDWQNLPRPQALYSQAPMFEQDLSIIDYITQRWTQRCKDELQYSREPFYRVEHFASNPHQIEHQRMLLKFVKSRASKSILLATLVYEDQVLSEAVVKAAFEDGGNLLLAAEKYAC